MRAELITDGTALARLEAPWGALFARVPAAPPFLAPAWLLPWWHVFAPGPLCTVAIWQGETLVGLAPLYREDGARGCRLLPLGIGLSDLLDVLLDPAEATEAGAALVAVLAAEPAWTVWSAEQAGPEAAVVALAVPPGCTSRTAHQAACPTLALPAPPADLREVLPARKQRKWRMAENRAQRRSAALEPTTPSTLADDLDALFHLHGLRWASRGEAGVLADERVRAFHRAAAPRLLAAGLLHMMVLRLEGVVAGVYLGLRHGTFACAYLGGFDPAFAFESPGTLLIGAAIAQAQAEGARQFSFLRGQEAYKYEWGATDRWSVCRVFERSS